MFTQRTAVIQQGPATTQLMFNHTQRSAAITLDKASSPLKLCLSTSFQPPLGQWLLFWHTVKKYPSLYQKNTCCTRLCRHPQAFYWILFSSVQPQLPGSKTFPPLKSSFYWTFPQQQQVLLKRKPTTPP